MNDETTIKNGTMLLKKHTRGKKLFYVVTRDPFHYVDGDKYDYVHLMRLRADGVGLGNGTATVVNRESGKLVGFTVVPNDQVPAAMKAWTRD